MGLIKQLENEIAEQEKRREMLRLEDGICIGKIEVARAVLAVIEGYEEDLKKRVLANSKHEKRLGEMVVKLGAGLPAKLDKN